MVSRDTTVHAGVVATSIAVLLVLSWAFPDVESPVLTFGMLVCYGFVLAGAHLFLAWLGEEGIVPVSSRWRFVGLVAGVVVLAAIAVVNYPALLALTRSLRAGA